MHSFQQKHKLVTWSIVKPEPDMSTLELASRTLHRKMTDVKRTHNTLEQGTIHKQKKKVEISETRSHRFYRWSIIDYGRPVYIVRVFNEAENPCE